MSCVYVGPSCSVIDMLTGGNVLDISKSNSSSPLKVGKGGVEDDNYFDSPGKGNKSAGDIEQWLSNLKKFTQSYAAISASIAVKAHSALQNRDNLSRSGDISLTPEVTAKVLTVGMNACESQLKCEGSDFLTFSNGRIPKMEGLDRYVDKRNRFIFFIK